MVVLFGMEDGTVIALLGAVAGTFTGLGAGIRYLAERKDKTRKDTLDEYKSLLDDTRKQLDRYQAVTESQQQAIMQMTRLHANCRAENREQYAFMVMLYGILRGCAASMGKANMPIPEIPDLPPRPDRSEDDNVIEFLKRTTEHNNKIIQEAREANGESAAH